MVENFDKVQRLFNLAVGGDLDGIRSYIQVYPMDVNLHNEQGMTFLMFAAMFGNEKLVEFLKIKGADLDLVSISGNTALIYSIINYRNYKNIELVGSLITEKILNLENKNGITPLMIAKKYKHEDVSKLLIEYGVVED